jgi:hypothetical protein
VFSRCFAQPHPSGLKRDANSTGCSSLLADSLDTLLRGSSSFHGNHSASTRASAARTAADLQSPFVERSLVLHTRRPTAFRRADKALTRFLIRWPKQGIVVRLVGTGCAAAGSSLANWSMRKLENGGFTIKPLPGDRVIRDSLQTALVTRKRRRRCSSQRPTP